MKLAMTNLVLAASIVLAVIPTCDDAVKKHDSPVADRAVSARAEAPSPSIAEAVSTGAARIELGLQQATMAVSSKHPCRHRVDVPAAPRGSWLMGSHGAIWRLEQLRLHGRTLPGSFDRSDVAAAMADPCGEFSDAEDRTCDTRVVWSADASIERVLGVKCGPSAYALVRGPQDWYVVPVGHDIARTGWAQQDYHRVKVKSARRERVFSSDESFVLSVEVVHDFYTSYTENNAIAGPAEEATSIWTYDVVLDPASHGIRGVIPVSSKGESVFYDRSGEVKERRTGSGQWAIRYRGDGTVERKRLGDNARDLTPVNLNKSAPGVGKFVGDGSR